jgi:hypothetical protein
VAIALVSSRELVQRQQSQPVEPRFKGEAFRLLMTVA